MPPELDPEVGGSPVALNQYVVGRGFHLQGHPLYCDDPGPGIYGTGPVYVATASTDGHLQQLADVSSWTAHLGDRCQRQATHAWKVRGHSGHEYVIARCSGTDHPGQTHTHADVIKAALRSPTRGYDLVEAILPIEGAP